MKSLLISLLLLCLNGCNTLKVTDDPQRQVSKDPIQNINRAIYDFNLKADEYVLRPIASGYSNTIPKPARTSVRNFFTNLQEPLFAINNLLQGKYSRALSSTYRFTVNSTLGLLGLFDVAKQHYDVDVAKEDLGQTMAAWGVKPGPYLMMPFLGPTNLRDGISRLESVIFYYPIEELSDDTNTQFALTALDIIDLRAGYLGTEKTLKSQLDPYSFFKTVYEKNRLSRLYDGSPPVVEEDFDDF